MLVRVGLHKKWRTVLLFLKFHFSKYFAGHTGTKLKTSFTSIIKPSFLLPVCGDRKNFGSRDCQILQICSQILPTNTHGSTDFINEDDTKFCANWVVL